MSPTPHKIIQPSAEQIDRHLDNVLTHAGSGLRHYTMHRSLELMRNAMRDALIEAAQAQAAGPDQVEPQGGPVAAQCRFEGDAEWKPCTVAHHLLVQAHPKEWPHYETRALYIAPAPAVPSLTSNVVNDACWKFVTAMPHKIPDPIWNDLKPAIYAAICHYHAALTAAPTPPAQHPDDAAVDRFAIAMKTKLAASRAKGRGGWDDPALCSVEHLARLLVEHIAKGDPVDVANFAMMLHQRGADHAVLASAQQPAVPEDVADALRDGLSACRSVSTCRDRKIVRDGVTLYAQTEEWCRWLEDEVGPKIETALEHIDAARKAGGAA